MAQYDLAIIGSGPAGEKAAAQAAYFGKRVAIIEKEPSPGGATVHTGALPSKTLREAALYLSGHSSREIQDLVVELNNEATLTTLLGRSNEISTTEADRMRANLNRHGVDYYQGFGRFKDAHILTIDGKEEISADFILISTGSRTYHPEGIEFASDRIHDTDELLTIDEIPRSMTIIGAGIRGCEYASMFQAFGTEVLLTDDSDEFLAFLDEEIAGRLLASMKAMGTRIELGNAWSRVEESDDGVTVHFADGSSATNDHLLYTAGRNANIDDMNLEAVGLGPNADHVLEVDELYRTAVPHILAAGDVIGFPSLSSVSMEQGRVAVCHAFGFDYKQGVSNILPYGIYTIPEVSAVGETEQSAREKGIDFVTGSALYKDNARGMIAGDLQGITKLIVENETNRVIGVHLIGEKASELVHIGQAAVVMGAPVTLFIDMVFNYPTLAESYKYAAYDALGAMDFNLMSFD